MAFPTISDADTKNGTVTSNSTSWTITYCTNIASGDLLLLFLASDGVQAFTAAGWTEIRQAATSPVSLSLMAKVAAGTETGTFTATASFTEQGGWRMFRVPAASWFGGSLPSADADPTVQKDANGIAVSAYATGASNVPNPPNLDPANWATEDTLWIAAIGVDTSRTISVYPYATRNTAEVSGGSTGATLGLCTTTSTSGSLDPGTFTISASDDWSAITVAIRPAAAAGNITVTPSTATLATAVFAPKLAETTTPNTLSLSLSTFAPVIKTAVIPSTLSLSTATFASTIVTTVNVTVTPNTLALTTSSFAPSLALSIIPSTASLTTAAFASTLATATSPSIGSLSLSTFAPNIVGSFTVVPPTSALSLSTFIPLLAEKTTPSTASLAVSTFAPAAGFGVVPSTLSVATSSFVPVLGLNVIPGNASLSTSTFAPAITANITPSPSTASLTVSAFAPSLLNVIPLSSLALSLTTFAPIAARGVVPDTASLTINSFAPQLRETATPSTATLTASLYAPQIASVINTPSSSLVTQAFAPVLNEQLTPDTLSLVLVGFAPLPSGAAGMVVPDTLNLVLFTTAPKMVIFGHRFESVSIPAGIYAVTADSWSRAATIPSEGRATELNATSETIIITSESRAITI